jgi:hypothetical protein
MRIYLSNRKLSSLILCLLILCHCQINLIHLVSANNDHHLAHSSHNSGHKPTHEEISSESHHSYPPNHNNRDSADLPAHQIQPEKVDAQPQPKNDETSHAARHNQEAVNKHEGTQPHHTNSPRFEPPPHPLLVDEEYINNFIQTKLLPQKSEILVDTSNSNAAGGANQPPKQPLVYIEGKQLMVEGKPFYIQGVCYSPVPIGESPSFGSKGDYFTLDYQYIWQRDLPLIKAMGSTTIRIYGWNNHIDHTHFLDAVHAAGLKILVTYYLGDAMENPVRTTDDRSKIIVDFVAQVARYADHPAILMWSFGNELNGSWNKFTQQISDAFGCWWSQYCAGYQDTNGDCQWQSTCMYTQLFSWINSAAKAAKMVTSRPIISGFADVDYMVGNNGMLDKVARFDWLLPDLAAWAMQLYRGGTFGGYFWMFRSESSKPMLVTEFGVDAYNDPCGWPQNQWEGGCFNMVGEGAGGDVAPAGRGFWGCSTGGDCAKPGVDAQVDWDMRLAKELMDNYPDRGGVVWGGFLMAWTDEYWKGGGTQDLCAFPCKTWDADYCRGAGRANYKPGGGAMCSYRAHFTCPNWDTNYHDLCG